MEYGIFLRVYTILVAMLHYDLLPIVLSGLTSLTILAVTVKKGVIKISKIKVPLSWKLETWELYGKCGKFVIADR